MVYYKSLHNKYYFIGIFSVSIYYLLLFIQTYCLLIWNLFAFSFISNTCLLYDFFCWRSDCRTILHYISLSLNSLNIDFFFNFYNYFAPILYSFIIWVLTNYSFSFRGSLSAHLSSILRILNLLLISQNFTFLINYYLLYCYIIIDFLLNIILTYQLA